MALVACVSDHDLPAPAPEKAPPPKVPSEANPPKQLPQNIANTEDQRVKEQLAQWSWTTPLGHMFRDYLYSENGPPPAVKAHDIVQRLFANPMLSITRRATLYVMINNLYETEAVDKTVNDRLNMLNTEVNIQQYALQAKTSRELLLQTPVLIAIALVAGSPLAGRTVINGTKAEFNRLLSLFGRAGTLERSQALWRETPLRPVFTRHAFSDYNVYKAASVFTFTTSSYAIFYYSLKTGATDSIAIQNKIWLYGLQYLVDPNDI